MAGAAGLPGERHTGRTRNFDIDLECRYGFAAVQPHLNAVAVNAHMLGDGRQYLFSQ
jgi:hypothetical protein